MRDSIDDRQAMIRQESKELAAKQEDDYIVEQARARSTARRRIRRWLSLLPHSERVEHDLVFRLVNHLMGAHNDCAECLMLGSESVDGIGFNS
jgi:hypothetical protein